MLVVKKMRRTQQRAMRRKSQRIGGKTRQHLGSQKMKVAQGKELSTMANVAKFLRNITTEK